MPEIAKRPFFYRQIDEFIRLGHFDEAKRALLALLTSDRPRKDWWLMANLYRRLGMPIWSLRLLNSTIYPKDRRPFEASPEEIIEYGAALIQLGSVSEAQNILAKVGVENAQVSFHRAMASMKLWNYLDAKRHLEIYLQDATLDDYSRAVGRVNLLACIIDLEDFDSARTLLSSLKQSLEDCGFDRLRTNLRELELQVHVCTANWAEAEQFLDAAESGNSALTSTQDNLYRKKWRCIYNLRRHPNQRLKWLAELNSVAAKAVELKDWETYRDCEYHEAMARRDIDLLKRVYAGTPNIHYRNRLKKFLINHGMKPDFNQLRSAVLRGPVGSDVLDIESMTWNGAKLPIKPGTVLAQCLIELLSDFYSAPSMGQLHEKIFPGRIYHPDSSPLVIHQTLRRVRKICEAFAIPLQLKVEASFVRTIKSRNFWLATSLAEKTAEPSKLREFKVVTDDYDFRVIDLAKYLQLSSRQALRLLEMPLKERRIVKIGTGRRTRYKFAA